MSWLHMPYFWIASGLMAVVQFAKVLEGKEELLGAVLVIPFGGLFWGAVATFIAKKLGKL